jgi:hypothetical protein
MILALALSLPVEAADLSRAWRKTPYGLATVLEQPPSEGCTKAPERIVAWACPQTVGDAEVTVHYMAEEEFFFGVSVECVGFSACQTLYGAVYEAWDEPFTRKIESDTSALADGVWNLLGAQDGETVGTWSYNRYTSRGSLFILQMGLQRAVEAKRKAAAQKAAEDL